MPDWTAIKTDFLATGMAYPALAKKWDVPLSTVKKRAMREKWSEQHAQVMELEPEPEVELEPVMEPEVCYAADMRAERSMKLLRTTDAMVDRIIDALDLIKPEDTYALSVLVRALKDLREMQGLHRSQLDVEEQRARIAKLKSETRISESTDGGGVLVLPTIEEKLLPPGGDHE